VPVTYGGASGLQVDLVSAVTPAECTEHPFAIVFVLDVVGDFHFETGSVGRLVALDVNGETILFIAEYVMGGEGTDPTSFLERAQGVLNSLVWALGGTTPPPASPSPSAAPQLPNTAQPLPVGEPSGGGAALIAIVGAVAGLSLVITARWVSTARRA
jgi:hypothetical protein